MSLISVLRVRDVYPGSEFSIPDPESRVKKILYPGSGSASKNSSIFNPKNCFLALGKIEDGHPGFGSRIWNFFSIPAPGSRGQKSTGSRIRIRNSGPYNTPFSPQEPPSECPWDPCVCLETR